VSKLKKLLIEARIKEARWWRRQEHVHTYSTNPKDLCYCQKRMKMLRAQQVEGKSDGKDV